MQIDHDILKACLVVADPKDNRPVVHNIHFDGTNVYATDGHMAIKIQQKIELPKFSISVEDAKMLLLFQKQIKTRILLDENSGHAVFKIGNGSLTVQTSNSDAGTIERVMQCSPAEHEKPVDLAFFAKAEKITKALGILSVDLKRVYTSGAVESFRLNGESDVFGFECVIACRTK